MQRFEMALTYRDGHVTRNGWVKTLHSSQEGAQQVLEAAAKSVPGFIACDHMIEAVTTQHDCGRYLENQVHFQLSIGNGDSESYFRAS